MRPVRRVPTSPAVLVGLVLGLVLADAVRAGGPGIHFRAGEASFATERACRLGRFPALVTVIPVPASIDPSTENVRVRCRVSVFRDNEGVGRARGSYMATVHLVDSRSGDLEMLSLEPGSFRTSAEGSDQFDYLSDLPIERIVAGEVSAWVVTEISFSNPKGDRARLNCNVSSLPGSTTSQSP